MVLVRTYQRDRRVSQHEVGLRAWLSQADENNTRDALPFVERYYETLHAPPHNPVALIARRFSGHGPFPLQGDGR